MAQPEMSRKKPLGRGLSSLLGDPEVRPAEQSVRNPAPVSNHYSDYMMLSIEAIEPNPDQPRRKFNQAHLDELSASIKKSGILQPIVVRETAKGRYQIIAGERRWRAAVQAELKKVPVILKSYSDQETLEMALVENLQRQDLNPVEEAQAYSLLLERYQLTQSELAEKVGKDRATIANSLRLLKLDQALKDQVQSGELSLGHAKVLLSLASSQLQRKWAEKCRRQNLSVRALELAIKKSQSSSDSAPSSPDPIQADRQHDRLNIELKAVAEQLQTVLGTTVSIEQKAAGVGSIRIEYYSSAQFNQLIDLLRDANGN